MPQILSTCLVLFLIFTISFSTEIIRIRTSILENEPTPLPLYGFLIYPSNANFKNCILPFISSSENLLKIYFHFQKLNPNVNLEKFLPYSRLKVTVVDLQKSDVAYIFENQFNPILISGTISAPKYKTIYCGSDIDETIDENSNFALFSSNKIISLKSYILPKNQEVFAARDESDGMFFVAFKKTKEKLIPISHGKIEHKYNIIEFPDYLNFILDAHNLNVISKMYFKLLDFWVKYNNFIGEIFAEVDDTCLKPLGDYLGSFIIFGILIALILYYHALILPFHILSIPLQFVLYRKIMQNFIQFWLCPCFFYFIFRLCFVPFDLHDIGLQMYSNEIKPQKTMFALPYLIERKKFTCSVLNDLFLIWIWGLFCSLPFVPLFSIHEEHNR